jgi:hypothetical protein
MALSTATSRALAAASGTLVTVGTLTSLGAVMATPVVAAPSEQRPRLQDFPSSTQFIQALEAWNRDHPDGVVVAPVIKPAPPAIVVTDPTSEFAPPPFEITGPENLAEAVEKAKSIEHPNYKEKIRYHRSTHLSFPLHSIDGAEMSQAGIADVLGQGVVSDEHAKDSVAQQMNTLEKDKATVISAPAGPAEAAPAFTTQQVGNGIHGTVGINVTGR